MSVFDFLYLGDSENRVHNQQISEAVAKRNAQGGRVVFSHPFIPQLISLQTKPRHIAPATV